MNKSAQLSQKFLHEINVEMAKIDRKISSINSSIKLLLGLKNKAARLSLSESKKNLQRDRSDLYELFQAIENRKWL